MASYLSVYRGSEGGAAKLALSQVSASNHPSVERALRLLYAAWTEVRLCRRSFKCRGASCMTCLSIERSNEAAQNTGSAPGSSERQCLSWQGRRPVLH